MLEGGVKVLGMPVGSLVDAVTSFFEYFSFLYDLGCFGMVVLEVISKEKNHFCVSFKICMC